MWSQSGRPLTGPPKPLDEVGGGGGCVRGSLDDGGHGGIEACVVVLQFVGHGGEGDDTLIGGAGHETVMKTVSNGAVALWWYKDQRRELAEDPRLIPNAIEEMLRWDNPAPLEGRQTTREVTLHGVTIPEDSRVMINMGAANHDERQYENPELFDIHRKIDHHLTFGYGLHFCIGAALARLEGRIALDEVLQRFPSWHVEADRAVQVRTSTVRGWDSLPVTTR